MHFRFPQKILFKHCDPAGIVFYPRYFEMTNSVAENFFRDVAGHPYEAMMEHGTGVPTARIEVDFQAPSRLGEVLDWRLEVTRLGGSSISLRITAHGGDLQRLSIAQTLVFVTGTGRPQPWPPAIRDRITAFMEAA